MAFQSDSRDQIRIIQEKERVIHMKMEQLKSRHDQLKNVVGDKEREALSREGEKLREMLDHIRR